MINLRTYEEFEWLWNKPRKHTDSWGTTVYKLSNGKIHRLDGPALINSDGTETWYKNGVVHRDGDEPAVEYKGGSKEWYKNGKLHRDGDKPAVVIKDGTTSWWVEGRLHRTNGPAKIYANGSEEWYMNGNKHREDGPAVELSNGKKEWYINDVHITDERFEKISDDEPIKKAYVKWKFGIL